MSTQWNERVSVSQEHILGFATCLYDYVLVKKDICD
jgi:hypothetical protein